MLRIFAANTSIPVVAACEICNQQIAVERSRDISGHLWINGEAVLKAWFDHQLVECKPPDEEVNDEGNVRG